MKGFCLLDWPGNGSGSPGRVANEPKGLSNPVWLLILFGLVSRPAWDIIEVSELTSSGIPKLIRDAERFWKLMLMGLVLGKSDALSSAKNGRNLLSLSCRELEEIYN